MLMCLLWHTGKVERQYDEVGPGTWDLGPSRWDLRLCTPEFSSSTQDQGPLKWDVNE